MKDQLRDGLVDPAAVRAVGVRLARIQSAAARDHALAELTLALMPAALRRVPPFDRETRAGRGWAVELGHFDGIGEIFGRAIGLVGIGEVARRLAPVLAALGGLVDEPALVEALAAGRLSAAGLDVFAIEPVDRANPLLALDNVVVMPHIARLTPETLERSLGVALDNCRRLSRGEALLHRVV